MISTKPIKQKACKNCKTKFMPISSWAAACSPLCGLELARSKRLKAEKAEKVKDRKETRAKLEKMKPRRKWLAECQEIVNKIVRLRDAHLGCCSCDKGPEWGGQWHASHLRSVGAASAVRFHLWNIAKSCSICNNHLSGNLSAYLPRARQRLGNEKVDWLYAQNHQANYSIEYLKRLKLVMGKKLKRMEGRIK